MGGASKGNRVKQRFQPQSKSAAEKKLLDDINYNPSAVKKSESTSSKFLKHFSPSDDESVDPQWSLTPYGAFKLLISARLGAALWNTIPDCDETFNYWEPAHYLLYGKGFQTWEYSPVYALRSYLYILLHAVPAKLYDYFLSPTPLLTFFFIRCFLAFLSAGTEAYLYGAIRKTMGGNIARITFITSMFSAGMFISSCAFLPSAFSAYMTALAIGAWLRDAPELAIFSVAMSGIVSWPFAALTGAFIAFDIVAVQRKFLLFIKWSLLSLFVIGVPLVAIDSFYYGKLVIAPLNIVKYNIFSNKGPDLYGTEPASYYIVNGTLNFNLIFLAALACPITILISWKLYENLKQKLFIVATVFLWLLVFIVQPHKEERFLFPIYPLISVVGALSIDAVQRFVNVVMEGEGFPAITGRISRSKKTRLVTDFGKTANAIGVFAIIAASLIGCSRIFALHHGYRAPLDIYFLLHHDPDAQEIISSSRNSTICYGKEWHRFPASFFVPSRNWNVRFIRSEFRGQLPNLYPAFDPEGTKRIPAHMNDDNAEEITRYVSVDACDFIVDLADPGRITTNEPDYSADTITWKILLSQPFLNSAQSDPFFRAFYIPWLSPTTTTFNDYVFLQRRVKQKKKTFVDDDDLM